MAILSCLLDLHSPRVVGSSMISRIKASLVMDALRMAVWQRQPNERLVVHNDRGSKCANHIYRELLSAYGFTGSMSRKFDCWDKLSLKVSSAI